MSTKKTTSSEPTYQSVWETLSKVDCNDQKKSKNGLSYLSWAWAWGILMEHYPDATYEFFDEQRDAQGYCEVWCRVKIGELERIMWLPVMNYKNEAMQNPDIRKVSDTRMRCLTKCIGMFGLGHYIYAGEDLPPDDDSQTEQKQAKEPEPKEAKAPAKKKEPVATVTPIKKEEEPAENHIGSKEEADNVLGFMMSTADTFATGTEQDLIDFWKQNKQVIDLLDENYNEHYEQLKGHFTALRQKLKTQKEGTNE